MPCVAVPRRPARQYHEVNMNSSGRLLLAAAVIVFAARCALYSEVSISPLHLTPGDITRHAGSISSLVEHADFAQAVRLADVIESSPRSTYRDYAALGRAELAAGRFDAARRHLRIAYTKEPFQTEAAEIAWDLSQTEYLANQYAAALEWARVAEQGGMRIRKWHTAYLEALASEDIYRFAGARSSRVSMRSQAPNVPRVEVAINAAAVTGIIDSGAVLSIVSRSFAERAKVRSIGDFHGTFYGLLGEPIDVTFGIVDLLEIGKMEVRNVPVAIMGDENLRFFAANRTPFRMDFLLGANLLKEFRLQLDFRRERALFTKLEARDRVVSDRQNLFWINFRPFVNATINRKGWYLFALDTGSEVTFLNENQLDATPLRNEHSYHSALLQGLGGSTKRGAKMRDISIGVDRWSGDFRTIPLYSTERTHAFGILGENFLQHFTVTLDFGAMRLALDKEMPTLPFEGEPGGSVASNPDW